MYFWDQNNLFDRADKGISREVSDSITRIVNRYDNHYEDRYNNLIRFFQEGFLMKYSNMLVLLFLQSYHLQQISNCYPLTKLKMLNIFIASKNGNIVKNIDVGLEGNSNNVTIKQYYTFSCQWGDVSGVRLSMDSSSIDGPLLFDNIYALDSKLDIIFAKSYSRMSQEWVDPINLNRAICDRSGGGLKVIR